MAPRISLLDLRVQLDPEGSRECTRFGFDDPRSERTSLRAQTRGKTPRGDDCTPAARADVSGDGGHDRLEGWANRGGSAAREPLRGVLRAGRHGDVLGYDFSNAELERIFSTSCNSNLSNLLNVSNVFFQLLEIHFLKNSTISFAKP